MPPNAEVSDAAEPHSLHRLVRFSDNQEPETSAVQFLAPTPAVTAALVFVLPRLSAPSERVHAHPQAVGRRHRPGTASTAIISGERLSAMVISISLWFVSANAPAQARRANDVRLPTETRSRRCLQPEG